MIKSFPSVISNLSDDNVNQLSTTTATTDNVFSSMKMDLPHSTQLITSNTDNNVDENDINMDSDDNLLIKKSSINVIPNETKLKPLDLVQDTSTDDDTIEDDQHSRKSVNKLVCSSTFWFVCLFLY